MSVLVLLALQGCLDTPTKGVPGFSEADRDNGERPSVTFDEPPAPLSGTITFTGMARDSDQPPNTLTLRLRSSVEGPLYRANPGLHGEWSWTGSLAPGEHEIIVEAEDGQGNIGRTGRTLRIEAPRSENADNRSPTCQILEPADGITHQGPVPLRFAAAAQDADGDALSLTWRDSAANVLSEDPVYIAALNDGPHQVFLYVRDEHGAECLKTVAVTVRGSLVDTDTDTGAPTDTDDTDTDDTDTDSDTGSTDSDTGSTDSGGPTGWVDTGDTGPVAWPRPPFDLLLGLRARANVGNGTWIGRDHVYAEHLETGVPHGQRQVFCIYTYDTKGSAAATLSPCQDADGNACLFAFDVTGENGRETHGDCSFLASNLPATTNNGWGYIDDFMRNGQGYGPALMYYYSNGQYGVWTPVRDAYSVSYDVTNGRFDFDTPISTYSIP